jgi:hypothetical protein
MPRVGFEPTNPSFRAGEDSSFIKPCGHCDRYSLYTLANSLSIVAAHICLLKGETFFMN